MADTLLEEYPMDAAAAALNINQQQGPNAPTATTHQAAPVAAYCFRHDPYAATVLEAREYPTPKVAPLPPAPTLVTVRFKRSTRQYVMHAPVASIGSCVLVEGDRGSDIGIIETVAGTCLGSSATSYRKVLGFATQEDVASLEELRTAYEVEALELVARRINECKMSKAMSVVDVEYQYDMSKVTIYFRPLKAAVDFRHLQRVLFRDFRCRVWLQNL
jgi:hypothetical protein